MTVTRALTWLRKHAATLATLGAAAAMAMFLSTLDWITTTRYLQQLGAAAPLVLIPYALVLSADTRGWRASFEHPARLRYWQLWRIRVATEALSNSLPAGVAIGETWKTVMLARGFGISISDAAANVVVSKFALALAHAAFLLTGLWLGASVLLKQSQVLIGRQGLFGLYAAVVLGFVALLVAAATLAKSGTLSRLLAGAMRISPAGLRSRLAGIAEPIAGLDRSLAVITRLPRSQVALSIGCFFLGWLSLGFENWLILSLLTPHATVATALSMEALVSVVRMVFFFIPAGFGAQDVSYFALLNLWGMPDAEAVATAFMLIKRAKEACWIAVGYVMLWLQPRAQSAGAPRAADPAQLAL